MGVLAAGLDPQLQGLGQSLVNSAERREVERELAVVDREIRRSEDERAVELMRDAAEQKLIGSVVGASTQVAAQASATIGKGAQTTGESGAAQPTRASRGWEGASGVFQAGGGITSATFGFLSARATSYQKVHEQKSRDASERLSASRESQRELGEEMQQAVQQARQLMQLENATTDAAIGSRA